MKTETNKDFNSVASDIIQESIKSAIFIDDNVLLPFENDAQFTNHSELLPSFEENSCTLSYYRYDPTWLKKSDFLFKNRDLLILDWQLEKNSDNYENSLKLLEKAINTVSLHFCCIYTDTPSEEFINKIILPILFYFNHGVHLKTEEKELISQKFTNFCDEVGSDEEEVKENLYPLLTQLYIYHTENYKRKEIIKDINSLLNDDNELKEHISKINDDFNKSLLSLFYAFEGNKQQRSNEVINIQLRNQEDKWILNIGNTIITIANKKSIEEKQFYDDFRKYIIKEQNIILTLLSLEYRNQFLRQSSFIGTEINLIDESAFFYHADLMEGEDEFSLLLNEIWKDTNTVFLSNYNSRLLNVTSEYRKGKESITEVSTQLVKDLARLNCYYNLVHNPIRKGKFSFGDIFKLYDENNNFLKYLLCITPHCDCLRPTKISNRFLFVESEGIKKKKKALEKLGTEEETDLSLLKNTDSYYMSFLNIKDPECVQWKCKPFSIYICDKQNDKSHNSVILIENEPFNIEYFCTLKENYAQRISNYSFGYANRVGISFAKLKN